MHEVSALLSEANRRERLIRCKQLLKQFPDHVIDFLWFSDKKVFTVEAPFSSQNDRLYAPISTKKGSIASSRLLRTRSTFTKSVMVSKMGVAGLFFVEPGIKVDGKYSRDVLLSQQMLPAIRHVAGDNFVFQQDSAPAHRRMIQSNSCSVKQLISFLQSYGPQQSGPCLLYTSPSPRDGLLSRMPSSA